MNESDRNGPPRHDISRGGISNSRHDLASENWSRVKGLFDAAVALDVSARSTYLARVCGDDGELRRHVEALLASHDQAQTFLETPAGDLIGRRAVADDLVGRTVGNYRIEARIGAGGMGEVYKAHDAKLDRPVALKLLPPGLATDADRLRRFHAEHSQLRGAEWRPALSRPDRRIALRGRSLRPVHAAGGWLGVGGGTRQRRSRCP